MEISIDFELNNDDFRLGDGSLDRPAICEALDRVAVQLMSDCEFGTIKDVNGNTVGEWSLAGDL